VTAERWARIKEVLHAALEAPPDTRATIVEQCCAGDHALRQEVESLLRFEGQAELFDTRAPSAAAAAFFAAPQSDPLVTPGQMLSQYRVIEELSRGGMGIVYRARDTRLDRDVALKLLHPDLIGNGQERERLLQEARAAAALLDPRVATVFEVDETDGLTFIAMEMIEGEGLREKLRAGPLPTPQVLTLAIDVADGLACAHAKGIVHRDVKPANIMITAEARAKLIDFGLAKVWPGAAAARAARVRDRTETQAGLVLGTVSYMSPEQAAGRRVDVRSDVFSLGLVLYEMLVGRLPREGSPRPLDLPATHPLRNVVQRCLAMEPAGRFENGTALAAELRRIERSLTSPRSARLRRVGAALVLVFAGLIGWLSFRDHARLPRLANPKPLTSDAGIEDAPSWSPDRTQLAYHANRAGSFDIWLAPVSGGKQRNLTRDMDGDALFPSWAPDGQRLAFFSSHGPVGYFAMDVTGGQTQLIRQVDATIHRSFFGPALWSRDGSRIAMLLNDPHSSRAWIEIRSTADGTTQHVDAPGRTTGRLDLSWSPDERFFAYVDASNAYMHRSQIWILRASDGSSWPITEGRSEDRWPTWASDGRSLWFVTEREGAGDLWRQALDKDGHPSGAPQPMTSGLGLSMATISPDGSAVAYAYGRHVTNITWLTVPENGPADWSSASAVTSDHAHVERVDVSPDGRTLAISSDRERSSEIWLMPAAGGEPARITDDDSGDWGPRWSPDGREIAFYSDRTGSRKIWVMSADGSAARRVTDGSAEDLMPAWSPDGRWLAFFSSRGGNQDVWIVPATGGEPRQITTNPAPDVLPEWSADSRSVFFHTTRSGQTEIWTAPIAGGPESRVTVGQTPRRSRDGTKLRFVRVVGGGGEIWERDLGSGAERRLIVISEERGVLWDYALDPGRLFLALRRDSTDLAIMDVLPQ
jgi:Tol biopolymer transport system component/predicted Ser/Thr protein kinase